MKLFKFQSFSGVMRWFPIALRSFPIALRSFSILRIIGRHSTHNRTTPNRKNGRNLGVLNFRVIQLFSYHGLLSFLLFFYAYLVTADLFAKDFGVRGHLFAIEEVNLLEQIQTQLSGMDDSGELAIHQGNVQPKIGKQALNPPPLAHITDAVKSEVFYFDPSITVPFDMKDHQGTIFARKGSRINPLDQISLSETLYFINGENEDQIKWLRPQLNASSVVILTRGKPTELFKSLGIRVYFDQKGAMSKRLKIKSVPTKVIQEGKKLRISSYVLPPKGLIQTSLIQTSLIQTSLSQTGREAL